MANFGGVKKPKDNSRRKGIAAQKKVRLRLEAEQRQAAYSQLTPKQKLAKLDTGKFAATKQRARIQMELTGSK